MPAALNAPSTSSVFMMTKRRLFHGDSKSPLDPLCLSPDDLQERLQTTAGLQEMILQNNRDHLISGKAYNTAGYTLQLIEHLCRECTVAEVIVESEGELSERSVIASISKINGILYSLAGLRLTLNKETGQIRLINESDAWLATEKFAAKFTKIRDEFIRTMEAYEAIGGEVEYKWRKQLKFPLKHDLPRVFAS
jgi:hypothetical protein